MGSQPLIKAMVEIPTRRFAHAWVNQAEVAAVVCLRIRNNKSEEYLVQWKSKKTDNLPYSWHPIHELAGDDGLSSNSAESALHHVQQYIDNLRRRIENIGTDSLELSIKRKPPENHLRRLSPFERLGESRSPSIFSANSDNSSRISYDDDEEECYNCTLEVKGNFIDAKLSSQNAFNTTDFPTQTMKERARSYKKNTLIADSKIRHQFTRGLTKIRGAKPVTLVNIRDSFTPSLTFEFVKEYKYGDGVEPPDPESMEGCKSCRPNMGGFCGCEYTKKCECLELARVDEGKLTDFERKELERRLVKGESTMGLPKRFPYHKGSGLLVGFYLDSVDPIYECNINCGCGPICKNRVVQYGRQIGLEIFRTNNRGWGLRSTEVLRAGQYVDTYLGEVIKVEEALRRVEVAEKGKNKNSYLFQLDKFDNDVTPKYEIDGEYVGGPTRFMNHSCDPNCAVYTVCYNKNNPYLYDLAFFALRDIKPQEELTFDYKPPRDEESKNMEDEENKEEENNSQKEPKEEPIVCRCGSRNCRKLLWV